MRGGAEKTRFLSRVKDGVYAVARRPSVECTSASVAGTISEFIEARADTLQERVARAALLNKVRVCPTCGKPNGHTLGTCNKCQQDISAVSTTYTHNLFSAFVLGIEREPKFPLKLSMRLETDRLMVFDDPLALSPLHFCAIPTTHFIPDWRYLALRPREGLALSRELVQACHSAADAQFLSDPGWRNSLLATGTFDLADMVMGYNYPPSQNQLHVQYMLPLLIPHQYMMFLRGVHYTPRRFFPVAFVEECLRALVAKGTHLEVADLERPIDDLLDILKKRCAVDYDAHHAAFLEKVDRQQQALSNWRKDNFEGICSIEGAGVKPGELFFESFDANAPESASSVPEHTVYEREKSVLQNYGKCADKEATSMGYYSHAKRLEDLDMSFVQL